MRTTKVAVDLRALVGQPTGIGYFTLSLLRELATRKQHRYLGLSQAPVHGADVLAAAGVDLEVERAPLGFIWQQFSLPRRVAKPDVDLLWSPLLTLPLKSVKPSVVTVHDLIPLLYPETHRLKVKLSFTPFIRSTVESARIVVVDSKATAGDLTTQFPQARDKVRVIYPGVDSDFGPGRSESIRATREGLDCPNGYILFVGTLEPRKNLSVLLDAWEHLRQERSAPPLIIVGPYGWRSRAVFARVQNLAGNGLTHLASVSRERLVELFQAARALVLPSVYEGFGLPALEAMACGIPAVVGNTSSLPEVVGDSGLLVEPDNVGDLIGSLRELLGNSDLSGELSARGIERASHFTWARAASQMEEVFSAALVQSSTNHEP